MYVVKVNKNIVGFTKTKKKADKIADSLRMDRKYLPSKTWLQGTRISVRKHF